MTDSEGETTNEIMPHPFYHYRDHSRDVNPDPLTPLTIAGRMPNFPAKLHAILSQPDFADIIAWLPHGRSWLVLNPREFESTILPVYFKTSKFSSFVRQANGWGFRRVMQGRDRNSYYHPKFLRFLPHLCKSMKRPAKSQKEILQTLNEPDFYKISQMYPVPDRPDDETMILKSTLQDGPQARMPIFTAGRTKSTSLSSAQEQPAESASPLNMMEDVSIDNQEPRALQSTDGTLSSLAPSQASSTGSLQHMVGATETVNGTPFVHNIQADRDTNAHSPLLQPNANADPVPIAQNNADAPATIAPASSCSSPVIISIPAPPMGDLGQATTTMWPITINAIPASATGAVTQGHGVPIPACLPAPASADLAQATTMVPMPQPVTIVIPGFPNMDPSSMAQFAAGFAWATAFMRQANGMEHGQQHQQVQPSTTATGTSL